MSERDEARAALEAIGRVRRDTAHRAASPTGYYAVAGFGAGCLTIGVGADGPWRWVLYVVGLMILLGAMSWYSRHTGIVTFATLRESGAWRAWIMIAVMLVGVIVAATSGLVPAVVGALVTFACWALLGPAWDAAWQRSLERQP